MQILTLFPLLNSFDNFALASPDKLTIGTYIFASVILKVALLALAALLSTQFSIHFNESSTFQLINGISNDLQKLMQYFSGAAIFIPFFVPLFSVLPILLALNLNEGALSLLVTSTLLTMLSLLKFRKLLEFSE